MFLFFSVEVEEVSMTSVSPPSSSLILSPAPTPITSPGVFKLHPSLVSEQSTLNLEKYRKIAEKLAVQFDLRHQWNELKVRGGFSTNEAFIGHLLGLEAARQASHSAYVREMSNQFVDTVQLIEEDSDLEIEVESPHISHELSSTVTVTSSEKSLKGLEKVSSMCKGMSQSYNHQEIPMGDLLSLNSPSENETDQLQYSEQVTVTSMPEVEIPYQVNDGMLRRQFFKKKTSNYLYCLLLCPAQVLNGLLIKLLCFLHTNTSCSV